MLEGFQGGSERMENILGDQEPKYFVVSLFVKGKL